MSPARTPSPTPSHIIFFNGNNCSACHSATDEVLEYNTIPDNIHCHIITVDGPDTLCSQAVAKLLNLPLDDANFSIARHFQIRSIPTLITLNNKLEVIDKHYACSSLTVEKLINL